MGETAREVKHCLAEAGCRRLDEAVQQLERLRTDIMAEKEQEPEPGNAQKPQLPSLSSFLSDLPDRMDKLIVRIDNAVQAIREGLF